MATRQGPRFGEEKGVQRNKDNAAGDKRPNRSPGQSNANRVLPSLREDVKASQKADIERMKKGLSPDAKSALTRTAQQTAGGRAVLRTAGRAGSLVGAALLGYEGAKAIGEASNRSYAETVAKRKAAEKAKADTDAESSRMAKSADARKRDVVREKFQEERPVRDAGRTKEVKAGMTNFEKAFAAARKDKKSEFTFGGKTYNTKTKEEMAKGGYVKGKK